MPWMLLYDVSLRRQRSQRHCFARQPPRLPSNVYHARPKIALQVIRSSDTRGDQARLLSPEYNTFLGTQRLLHQQGPHLLILLPMKRFDYESASVPLSNSGGF